MRSAPWLVSVVLVMVGGLVSYVGLPRQLMIGEATVPVPSLVAGLGLDVSGGLMVCGFVLLALQLDRWLNRLGAGHDTDSQELDVDEQDDEELATSR